MCHFFYLGILVVNPRPWHITHSASARRLEGNGFDSRPKPLKTLKMLFLLLLCQMRYINSISMGLGSKQLAQYHAQLGLPDKGHEIKGLVSLH